MSSYPPSPPVNSVVTERKDSRVLFHVAARQQYIVNDHAIWTMNSLHLSIAGRLFRSYDGKSIIINRTEEDNLCAVIMKERRGWSIECDKEEEEDISLSITLSMHILWHYEWKTDNDK